MKMVLFISWLLLLSPMIVVAQVDHSHFPAPAEDCAKLSPDMQSVIAAMDGPGSRIEALPRPERIPAIEPGLHKLEVVLRPLSEVRLVERDSLCRQTPGPECAMAEKTKPKENVKNLFGGFVRLTVPKDGTYRISADSTLWIEIIDGERPIERLKTVPRFHCGRIHKSLGFPLQREKSYWLELSGSTSSAVALLVTEESDR